MGHKLFSILSSHLLKDTDNIGSLTRGSEWDLIGHSASHTDQNGALEWTLGEAWFLLGCAPAASYRLSSSTQPDPEMLERGGK